MQGKTFHDHRQHPAGTELACRPPYSACDRLGGNAHLPSLIPLEQLFPAAVARLERAGVEAPRREARLLAAHVMGRPEAALLDSRVTIDEHAFEAAIRRREAREPLAFIIGRRGFWSLDVGVSKATLIPRADSEALIEAAMAHFRARDSVRDILDLGTGTGCLLLAALAEFPAALGLGVDIAPAAVRLAARNASDCGLSARARFVAGSWAESLAGWARFDLILCNPPYIRSEDIRSLMPEVAMHEPRRALDGGADGLQAYRTILPAITRLLRGAGAAVLEIGQGQFRGVCALAAAAGLAPTACRDDLGGIPRALVLQRV